MKTKMTSETILVTEPRMKTIDLTECRLDGIHGKIKRIASGCDPAKVDAIVDDIRKAFVR